MSLLAPAQFYKSVNDNVAPAYFFYGDETYLIEDAVRRVHQKVFGTADLKPSENLSLEIFYGSERPLDAVMNSAQSLGFFSLQKMLLLKETGSFKDKDFAELQKLIENPNEGTTLVFTLEGALPRAKFFKTLSDKAVSVNFKTPYEREFPQWIQYLAKENGVTLGAQVPLLLLGRVGPNMMALNNEIRKLKLSVGAQNHIDDAAVQNWIAQSKEESVFELANAIGNHDQGKSFTLLRRLLFQGQNVVGILTIIARHLRILLQLKTSGDTSQLGIPPFFLKDYQRQSADWKVEELSQAMQDLRVAESQIKSTSVSPELVLGKFLADNT